MDPFRREVIYIVGNGCNAIKDANTSVDDVFKTKHALAGFIPTEDDKFKIATKHAAGLASNTKCNRPHQPESWFSNSWGNPVAMVLKRMIVVVTYNTDDTVLFQLFSPENLDRLSCTHIDGFTVMTRTKQLNIKSLKDSIDIVRNRFQDSLPPVFLHNFINGDGGRYKYYKENIETTECPVDEPGGIEAQQTQELNRMIVESGRVEEQDTVLEEVVEVEDGGEYENKPQEGEQERRNPEQGDEGRVEEEGDNDSEQTKSDNDDGEKIKRRKPILPGLCLYSLRTSYYNTNITVRITL